MLARLLPPIFIFFLTLLYIFIPEQLSTRSLPNLMISQVFAVGHQGAAQLDDPPPEQPAAPPPPAGGACIKEGERCAASGSGENKCCSGLTCEGGQAGTCKKNPPPEGSAGSSATACAITKVGNAPGKAPPLPPECGAGDLVFPVKASKEIILAGSALNGQTLKWCATNQANCHHDFNAADIFAPTGTQVVAATSGTVTQAHDSGGTGHTVHVKGDDNKIYYYAHLGGATVTTGQKINKGDPIGAVGTAQDAQGTAPHLHFDILPDSPEFNGKRPACSSGACAGKPFINPQPQLIKAFQTLQ